MLYIVHRPSFFYLKNKPHQNLAKKKDSKHRRNLGWGRGKRLFSDIFINEKDSFRLLSRRGANEKIAIRVGGKGCTYIKDWFRQIFPFYLT